jgi:hypothetical protein
MARGVGGRSPANIARFMKNIDFPADKQEIVEHAEDNNADQEVIDVLNQIPEREYHNMADLEQAVADID